MSLQTVTFCSVRFQLPQIKCKEIRTKTKCYPFCHFILLSRITWKYIPCERTHLAHRVVRKKGIFVVADDLNINEFETYCRILICFENVKQSYFPTQINCPYLKLTVSLRWGSKIGHLPFRSSSNVFLLLRYLPSIDFISFTKAPWT